MTASIVTSNNFNKNTQNCKHYLNSFLTFKNINCIMKTSETYNIYYRRKGGLYRGFGFGKNEEHAKLEFVIRMAEQTKDNIKIITVEKI